MVASEAVPYAKTGGLADVLGALPVALARLGHRVTVVLPRYRGVENGRPVDRLSLALGNRLLEAGIYEHEPAPGVRVLLLDCPELYDRDGLYGVGHDDYADNAVRFAFLSRAALGLMARAKDRPSIVHAHDWQAGLAPVYLNTRYAADPILGNVASILTIHNLAYQGLFPAGWLPALDLGWDLFTPDALEFWGHLSLLKGGIVFSDLLTTVSRTYAEEIRTPEQGRGFEGILESRASDLVGILNGIDQDHWNPATDPHLPKPFDATDLSGKAAAKSELLRAFGFAIDAESLERPVIGMVSRLVDQKGFDLLAALGAEWPRVDATLVLLGTGDPRYERFWTELAALHPGRIGARIGFDERLAHLIEGGADIFLMPSRFEPCGLNQMYSLRYGTVPVVRATGGLADTVRDYIGPRSRGTGFTFAEYTPEALLVAIHRALAAFCKTRTWNALQRAGMREDHSWDASAREYVKVYERAMTLRANRMAAPAGRAGQAADSTPTRGR